MNADPNRLPGAALELLTALDATGRPEKAAAADHFRNLLEVPVLFYLLCVAIVASDGSTPGLVTVARVVRGLLA